VHIKTSFVSLDSTMTCHEVFQETTGVDRGNANEKQTIRTLRGDSDIIPFTCQRWPAPQESEAMEAVEAVVPRACDAHQKHSDAESVNRRTRGKLGDQETGDKNSRRALLFRAESVARLSRQATRNSEWDRLIDK